MACALGRNAIGIAASPADALTCKLSDGCLLALSGAAGQLARAALPQEAVSGIGYWRSLPAARLG
ncbi:hypothetical protein [Chromobacterium sphagni]|uniref:Uncharacterized protein n=1 Tax=Chromobacterium sphagni TaxID=1903179 RepID=A0ABX3CAB5_9NEIS|nr:hypothetical protein [Chromobacterium sphagni]OHX19092.1 hypothetical protein BI344_19470 [Chromobacterium sphagni]